MAKKLLNKLKQCFLVIIQFSEFREKKEEPLMVYINISDLDNEWNKNALSTINTGYSHKDWQNTNEVLLNVSDFTNEWNNLALGFTKNSHE